MNEVPPTWRRPANEGSGPEYVHGVQGEFICQGGAGLPGPRMPCTGDRGHTMNR